MLTRDGPVDARRVYGHLRMATLFNCLGPGRVPRVCVCLGRRRLGSTSPP